jgi:hypothetical protein
MLTDRRPVAPLALLHGVIGASFALVRVLSKTPNERAHRFDALRVDDSNGLRSDHGDVHPAGELFDVLGVLHAEPEGER